MLATPAGEPAPPVRKRGRPRDPQADVRILGAAAELILSRGFDAMTVDEVAARAKVGKATVYRRWARKDDLAVAAMQNLYDRELPMPDTGSIREDLLQLYTGMLSFANSPVGASFLHTTVAESVRDPRIASLYRAAATKAERSAEEMLVRAVERGELRAGVDTSVAVRWLSGLVALSLIVDVPMPTPDQAGELVDMLLRGIGGPGTSPA